MDIIPTNFLEYLMSCSSEKRKYILSESINLTCTDGERKELFLKLNETINNNSTLAESRSHDAKNLINYISDIGVDDDLIGRLYKEAESLDLKTRSASAKVKTQFKYLTIFTYLQILF